MPLITKAQAHRMGIPKKTLQTVEIPREWGLATARKWMKKNNFANAYYRRTVNFYKFLQTPDIKGASYYSKVLPNGAILVTQEY